MKKLLSALLAAAMTACAVCVPASAEELPSREIYLSKLAEEVNALPVYALGEDASAYSLGDVNMDGAIDTKDGILIMTEYNDYTVVDEGHVLTEAQLALADVDGLAELGEDDPIDIKDAIIVMCYYNYTDIVGVDMTFDDYLTGWFRGDFKGEA